MDFQVLLWRLNIKCLEESQALVGAQSILVIIALLHLVTISVINNSVIVVCCYWETRHGLGVGKLP